MSTRIRRRPRTEESFAEDAFELDSELLADDISDEEIEAFLAAQEEEKDPGFWNLPTIAGLSIIGFGIAYLLQQIGLWPGFDLSVLAGALPWLAGVLIILLGFGVLGWKPKKRKKKIKSKSSDRVREVKEVVVEEIKVKSSSSKKKLTKSVRNRKLAGVAGGLGEYFGVDPTLIRIAFVIGAIFGSGVSIPLYIILAFIMNNPEKPKPKAEERITIIRES